MTASTLIANSKSLNSIFCSLFCLIFPSFFFFPTIRNVPFKYVK